MSPFISLNDITIRIGSKFLFDHTTFTFFKNQQWLIVGPNGSGKSTLAKAIAGLLPLKTGEIICHFVKNKEFKYPSVNRDTIAYLSFETQYQMLKKDSLQRDLESYMGVYKTGMIVEEYIFQKTQNNSASQNIRNSDNQTYRQSETLSFPSILEKNMFNIFHLFSRELSTLSTGEMRKVFLVKIFLQKPQLLILDEPFDGLDNASKKELKQIISQMMKSMYVILITHREDEIVDGITDVMEVKDGRIEKTFERVKGEALSDKKKRIVISNERSDVRDLLVNSEGISSHSVRLNDKLISMDKVTVKYGEKIVLDNISWTVYVGQNWAILGPNGSGKSTLMHLITGDNLQKYANDITVLGNTTKASLWDIKKNIGIVSSNIMLQHTYEMKAYDVILSGFFDSIGLYKKANMQQKEQTNEWIKKLHIEHLAEKPYQELSFGQKRIILIARAVIKSPQLLIMDEPCHGLDAENKQKVLDIIQEIGMSQKTNILLITHNRNEIVASITNILQLENGHIVDKI